MLGGASNSDFIHALLIEGDNLGLMGRMSALVKEIALGQEWFAGGLARRLEQNADLTDGQTQHERQVGLAQKDRSLRMLPAIFQNADNPSAWVPAKTIQPEER